MILRRFPAIPTPAQTVFETRGSPRSETMEDLTFGALANGMARRGFRAKLFSGNISLGFQLSI